MLAAAVLHHLRTDEEWRDVFTAFHRALRPGGSVWVFDLVESSIPAVQQLMWRRYGEYLTRLKDEAYRDHVFAYVEKEDTPRPLAVPTGPAAAGRVRPGRSPAQERLLCGLRRREGLTRARPSPGPSVRFSVGLGRRTISRIQRVPSSGDHGFFDGRLALMLPAHAVTPPSPPGAPTPPSRPGGGRSRHKAASRPPSANRRRPRDRPRHR